MVMASGKGTEGVGQRQTPAEQTSFTFPCWPGNDRHTKLQLASPLAHLVLLQREQSTGGAALDRTRLRARAWQPRVRLWKDLIWDKRTLIKLICKVRHSYISHLVSAGSALWKITNVFLAAGPEGCAGSTLLLSHPGCRREVLLAGSRITLLSPFDSCCWL